MSDPDDSLDDVYGPEMRPHHQTTELATLRARLAEVEARNEAAVAKAVERERERAARLAENMLGGSSRFKLAAAIRDGRET